MIRSIRKNVSFGTINRIFIVVMILALAGVFSLPMMLRNGSSLPWSLKVNGQIIPKTKFLLTVEDQRERLAYLRTQYGQYIDTLQMMGVNLNPESLAVEQLSQQILLQQLANRMHLVIDPVYALEKIQDHVFAAQYLSSVVPAFLFDSSGDIVQDRLKLYLQKRNMTSDKLLEEAQNAIQQMIAVYTIEQFSYLPSFDLGLAYQAQKAQRKFSIATFGYQQYQQKAKFTEVSDEVLRNFFIEQNKTNNRYYTPEQRTGTCWKFADKSYNISVSKADIENFYQLHKNTRYVLQPARAEVRIITYLDSQDTSDRRPLHELQEELVQNPERFADYAKKYSDDEKSAQKGGLLAPFARGGIQDKAMEKAAFTLPNEGDISNIVPVEGGKAIVQLVRKYARSYIPLAEVAQKIKKKLQKELFKKQFNADLRQLRSTFDATQLAEFCKKHSATKESIAALKPESGSEDLAGKALFSLKSEGSFDGYTQGLVGYIVVLDTINKKQSKSFESVAAQVRDDYVNDQALTLISQDLAQAKKDLQAESLEVVAQRYNAKIENTDWITPMDQQQIKKLQNRGLPASQMFQIETKNAALGYQGEKNGYLIVLSDIESTDSIDQAKKLEFKVRQEQETKNRLVESVIASLHRDATIEINETPEILNENYYL